VVWGGDRWLLTNVAAGTIAVALVRSGRRRRRGRRADEDPFDDHIAIPALPPEAAGRWKAKVENERHWQLAETQASGDGGCCEDDGHDRTKTRAGSDGGRSERDTSRQ
jgi:hypothetical protein